MAENTLDPTPAPLEHAVRLLHPFWIEPGRLDKAVGALGFLRHAAGGREFKAWQETGRTPGPYREDILPLVAQVLFGIRSGANRYLRVDREAVDRWFPPGGRFGPEGADGPAQGHPLLPAAEGVELFLSPHGAGFLVLSFDCPEAPGLAALRTLNHRLSQQGGQAAWQYRASAAPPGAEAPFEQRLGGGGAFALKELADFLLSPLKDFGLQETQQQFSVYSLTRFDRRALFADPACQAGLRPFLAALTHVEDAAQEGSLGLRERQLTPRHWAAVGSLGAAHLLADAEPPAGRGMENVLYGHFVPYLCASLQRLTLQRLLWETDEAVLETDDSLRERQAKLRRLNQDMLRFSVQGCFTEISSREVLNQYYELALEGLRVPPTLALAQRVLRDMGEATTAAFQQKAARDARELADGLERNAGIAASTQNKLEWLAVVFATYYAATLVHYVGADFFTPDFAQASLAVAPLFSGILALAGLRPYAKKAADGRKHPNEGSWAFLGSLLFAFWVWAAMGWQYHRKEIHPEQGQSFLCAQGTDCGHPTAEGTI